MPSDGGIDLVVFDVLGTLVNEPAGLRRAIGECDPTASPATVESLVELWQNHVAGQQDEMVQGRRAYAAGDRVDREAAARVAAHLGIAVAAAIDRLATAGSRLDPWPDTIAALGRLSSHFPVVGLSNASRSTLIRLNAYAGLRWHLVLSAEDARSYKPSPDVYRLALDVAGTAAPDRVLMVAAHAWDLRGAQAVGLRTAYVERPVGDPPTPTDTFDYRADSLDGLVDTLLEAAPAG